MSIRLRFTLLYTLILALTLMVFGAVLYTIQDQNTINSLKRDLIQTSSRMAEATLRTGSGSQFQGQGHAAPKQPIPFDQFSSDQAFQTPPPRDIVRVLDANGQLISSPMGKESDALPLSSAGLAALQNQKEWWENNTVLGEEMLIYSRPVILNNKTVYIIQSARTLSERNTSLQSLASTLLIAGILTVLVAFGIGWVLSEITLRPIQRITQTAREIGEKHDFTQRVIYKGPLDEVGQLANTFNSMLARLQEAFQKVEHSLEMQKNFVADVSHELRTPLTTIRGNLELLGRVPQAAPEEQADILNDMVGESDRLMRLVNDLLVLARADAGRNLNRENVELSSVIEEACRQANHLDAQRRINWQAAPDLVFPGDRDAIKQVLLIAIDNALKHSLGDIGVYAGRNGEGLELRVQDQGEGIDPEKLEHVFDRFYRGDETAPNTGFGLGLSIAKSLVEKQGGTIHMESEIGRGSTLVIHFN